MKQDLEARSTDNARLSAQLAQVHKDSQAEISRLSSQVDALKDEIVSERQAHSGSQKERDLATLNLANSASQVLMVRTEYPSPHFPARVTLLILLSAVSFCSALGGQVIDLLLRREGSVE